MRGRARSRTTTIGAIERTRGERTRNHHVGDADSVVQASRIDRVLIAVQDRRGVVALAVVAVLSLVAVVLVSRDRQVEEEPAVPLAVVADYRSTGTCDGGKVVDYSGTAPVPFERTFPGTLGPGGRLAATVQGVAGLAVVVRSAEIRVERRFDAVPGTYLPDGCQAEVPVRYFDTDLTAAAPVLAPVAGTRTFPYSVDRSEPEQLVVVPRISGGAVEWRLVLRWSSGARTGELVVDDGGKPFRTTSLTAARLFCSDHDLKVNKPC
ncbi:hypothetical protein [Actinosynnema sp. NPDC020468]|uniref:hypothetical protein n=1 Tax=Actinosynnema sp. NPDC020468 TaxID=3154488 RepID=UPI0033F58884